VASHSENEATTFVSVRNLTVGKEPGHTRLFFFGGWFALVLCMKKSILNLFAFIVFMMPLTGMASESVLCTQNSNLDQRSFSETVQSRTNSGEFTLVNWNAHKLSDSKFLSDLVLLSQSADLITLQEAMHSTDYEQLFLRNFKFDVSFFKSFCFNKNKDATGVMTLSRIHLENNLTLLSPGREPITNTPKVSGYSLVRITGVGPVHIINTHALNFNLGGDFKRHIDSIEQLIHQLQGPVIWVGDFNTWNNIRTSYLMKAAEELGLTHVALSRDSRLLKLDHVFVRGLNVKSAEVLNNFKSSDHKPIRVIFSK
jgi:endonuclease/exonuclease/phosphatase (EEP) superfamily protein YafD